MVYISISVEVIEKNNWMAEVHLKSQSDLILFVACLYGRLEKIS